VHCASELRWYIESVTQGCAQASTPILIRAAVSALLLASCVRQPITVTPQEVHRHVRELQRNGRATVVTEQGGTHDLSLQDELSIELGGSRLLGLLQSTKQRRVTVRDLIANCPEVRPFREDRYRRASCLLLRTSSEAIPVDTRLRPNWTVWKTVGGALLVTVVVGSLIMHLDRCKEPDDGC